MEEHIDRNGLANASPPPGGKRRRPALWLLGVAAVLALGIASLAAVGNRGWDWLGVAAACVLLLGLGGVLWRQQQLARRREASLAEDRALLSDKAAQLEATLANMNDGVMMVDAELRLLAWNDRFPVFAGVPPEVLRVGTPMADILRAQAEAGEFGPVVVEDEVERRMTLLRSGGSIGTMQRLRPGGRVLELRRNPIAGGGFVTLYADVTARQEAEQRLRQAEKMAAVGRLTAGIVHDFNNLLASVLVNAELLERDIAGGGDPALARRIGVILQSAERGSELVGRLLAFARKQPVAAVAVDLNNVVLGMVELLQSTVGSTVELRTLLADGLWPALADTGQMEQVILNLAINARDAMPGGGVLSIATENLPQLSPGRGEDLPGGDYVSLAVTDTGTGMTEDVRRHALEPFFTTKPAGEGTGLGLSQVYGLASQFGGGVEIDSAPGRGTTVRILLPRADVH